MIRSIKRRIDNLEKEIPCPVCKGKSRGFIVVYPEDDDIQPYPENPPEECYACGQKPPIYRVVYEDSVQ